MKLPFNFLALNPFYPDYDSSQNQHWTQKWKPYILVLWISVGCFEINLPGNHHYSSVISQDKSKMADGLKNL